MNLTKRIVAATLAVTTMIGATTIAAPAAQAQTRTSLTVAYGDVGYRGYRGDYRRDDRRDYRGNYNGQRRWDRDRDGIPNRYDRYDNRRGYAYRGGYHGGRNCRTEWRYDRGRHDRVRVRVCY